jgi:hypothetical protein
MITRLEKNAAFLLTERRNRLLIAFAVALSTAVILWISMRHPLDPLNSPGVAQRCQANYARAQSSRDTAIVDVQAPVLDPETPTPKVTCGELRMAGRLRR